MSTSNFQAGQGAFTSAAAKAAMDALPPQMQDLLRPGKTPERIRHAINWAARHDPDVLAQHRRSGHKVASFEEIHNLPHSQLDAVAQYFVRKYRTRALITGAITGMPGGLWALVAAGADVQLTAIYAVRMAADVAQSYGYDTSLAEEQAHLAEVLALAAGIDSLRGIGNWLTREGVMHMLPEALPKVMMRISVEITEEQAAKWVGRLIPGVGALVGGTIDYTFLRVAGERALAYYRNRYLAEHGIEPGTTHLSPPARAFAALAGNTETPPALAPAGNNPAVVEGSIVTSPAYQVAGPVTPAQHAPAQRSPIVPPKSQQQVIAPPRKARKSAPERIGVYLAIFAVFAMVITILACWALGVLAVSGAQHLFG